VAEYICEVCGCRQYRMCGTGKCPMGITTQDPELRARFDIEKSTKRLEDFPRLTGNDDVHKLSIQDLCTTNSEISNHTEIEHV
jgi:glutamate synthase domain-containing protein 2